MVDSETVRRIALALPDARDESDERRLVFSVNGRGFAWTWNERIHPRKPKQPNLRVLAVVCALEEKETLLELDPAKQFTEPHYNGFPAILVRLDAVDEANLQGLLATAHRCITQAKPTGPRRKV